MRMEIEGYLLDTRNGRTVGLRISQGNKKYDVSAKACKYAVIPNLPNWINPKTVELVLHQNILLSQEEIDLGVKYQDMSNDSLFLRELKNHIVNEHRNVFELGLPNDHKDIQAVRLLEDKLGKKLDVTILGVGEIEHVVLEAVNKVEVIYHSYRLGVFQLPIRDFIHALSGR